ncbi:scarecrow-like protein 34 [Sorghum bicolor]|uniref:Uncharacterized protein n=2 Tax=Sorghum bicolor TaxID=4558 RepID=A0A1Z5S6H0_SORBI|nr:scarecrow-like protein 34 [Sorghum bicolor]OQU91406.1 hypothetical protein SORBI_3001G174300 [Sorghum bicolor]|eukprot:XP_021314676.1 scarecrow-like protein 34 [Sorghum bicolor]
MGTCKALSDFWQGSRTPSMEFNDKSSSNFEDFQSNMSATSGFYALVDPADESNDLESFLHQPRSKHHYPPVSNTFSDSDHITLSTPYSSTVDGPQFCDLSSNAAPDWYGTSVADSSNNSWTNSDITIDYLNKLLMDEDDEDKVKLHHGECALRAMEEPFYRILGQNNPAYPESPSLCSCGHLNNLDDSINKSSGLSCSSCSVAIDSSNSHSNHNLQAFEAPWSLSDIVKETKRSTEGTRNMEFGVKIDGLSIAEKRSRDNQSLQVNAADTSKHASSEVHSGYFSSTEDSYLSEARSSKQVAFSFNEPTRDEMFDRVLLFSEHKPTDEAIVLQEMMTNKSTGHSQNEQGRTSARRKTRGKKQQKKEVVDLRAILIHCAQAVSVNNHTLANDMLNIIRQHSSITGDDTQRLAFCLVDCLEVRLAGTGCQLYRKLITKSSNAVAILKVLQLSLAVNPLLRASFYFSNKTILDVSKGKSKVHIIDFGICFGFQWPSLFEQLAKREDGPPKVRITGIEQPMQGFRPNQMNKQNTGQRLADYASMFNVPFEYQAISSMWETISIEDLNIEEDDVLIVNCIDRMKILGDETVSINSARNKVLNTIRMMKPKIFVHGVVNGSYGTPIFLTRFKEVMYHYSALFDIFDKTVPRDNETRLHIERSMFLSQLLNVIACEGSERIERPENYKKWKSRSLNAGLEQLPLNPDIVEVIREMVGKYHKDYVIYEDDQWLLLGWKGRILNGISTWKPSESYVGD